MSIESTEEYLAWLEGELTPLYLDEAVLGHDLTHVRTMLAIGRRINHLPGLDLDLFDVAVWLHNLDRVPAVKKAIDDLSFSTVLIGYLENGPFTANMIYEICAAVVNHSKKDDEPGDSELMRALRAADKVSRLNLMGALTSAQIHGRKGLYDPSRNPFAVELEEQGGWPLTVYDDVAGRLMEWIQLLPPDARYLVDRTDMRELVTFVRMFAGMACRHSGADNGVESDLRRALGEEDYEVYSS